ncbi:MAG: carbohydrate binding family 9 domain-containing protein [Vicinamibacteria bacterium]|nr:carbohydrate binding family 9 domain-containing protein [Vicinamibacteria bacterium]
MSRRALFRRITLIALAAAGPGASFAQAADPRAIASAEATRPVSAARLLPKAPPIDGDVIDDPAWSGVAPIAGFRQTTPDDGAPVSERTEVRIAHTEDALLVAVVCFDSEPAKLVVSDSRRDSPLDDVDSFRFILDTYRDGQNGFVFGTSPAGGEYDAQVSLEGREGDQASRQQSGAGGGFNLNWDAAWTVRTRTGDFGWSAEFSIPFKTLRYPRGGEQAWGLNMQRNIRRKKEVAYWAPLPRQYNILRVSRAGVLEGVKTPAQRNLKITPYLLGSSERDYRSQREFDRTAQAGGDLKYSITPSLTLDLTVNTDFAQVEVDEQQVNLDRFSLFFPEKRPFFLENAGQFTVGNSGEVDLFFSRRIGIASTGEQVPIAGGGRVSGRVHGWNVGLLDMQTKSVEGVVPANNFAVVRISRDLPKRSGFGVLFINRRTTGDVEVTGVSDFNRTYAVDGRKGLGRYAQITGFLAGTSTPGIRSDARAWDAAFLRESPRFDMRAKYTDVGAGFNPEVGFLRRRAFRKIDLHVLNRTRPKDFIGIHELRPHISYRGYFKPDGFYETGFAHFDNHWEFKSQWEIDTGVNLTHEGLRAPFNIAPGVTVPVGRYDNVEAQIVGISPVSKPVSVNVMTVVGGYYGGRRLAITPTIRFRAGDKLSGNLNINYNRVNLPEGKFEANLFRLRASYSFSPRVFVQSLVQYNQQVNYLSGNFRFGWLQSANAGLFIVYNEGRERDSLNQGIRDETTFGRVRDRSLVIKFSRLIDVFN